MLTPLMLVRSHDDTLGGVVHIGPVAKECPIYGVHTVRPALFDSYRSVSTFGITNCLCKLVLP